MASISSSSSSNPDDLKFRSNLITYNLNAIRKNVSRGSSTQTVQIPVPQVPLDLGSSNSTLPRYGYQNVKRVSTMTIEQLPDDPPKNPTAAAEQPAPPISTPNVSINVSVINVSVVNGVNTQTNIYIEPAKKDSPISDSISPSLFERIWAVLRNWFAIVRFRLFRPIHAPLFSERWEEFNRVCKSQMPTETRGKILKQQLQNIRLSFASSYNPTISASSNQSHENRQKTASIQQIPFTIEGLHVTDKSLLETVPKKGSENREHPQPADDFRRVITEFQQSWTQIFVFNQQPSDATISNFEADVQALETHMNKFIQQNAQ